MVLVNDGDVSATNPMPVDDNGKPAILFSTTSNLSSGATYDSTPLDVRQYSQVQTHILSSDDGTVVIDFCSDSGGTDVVRTLTIPYLASTGFQFFAAPAFSDYIRYRFTNDGVGTQTDFLFETKITTTAISPQLLRVDGFINPAMVSSLNRSVIVGQDPAGNYRNTPTDTEGHLKISVHDPVTAFGDLRVAELTPKIHLTFPYNINADIVDKTETNSGTVTQADSMAVLQTSTNVAGEAEILSRDVLVYRSGLGGKVRFTSLFSTSAASSTQLAGIGDSSDGFYFGFNGTAFGVNRIQDGTSNWIAQTAWNVDVMDGTGGSTNPSSMTLDTSKLNVYQIQYQWLGAGQIEFSIEDESTGLFVPVHRLQYANNFTVPSVYNAALPLRLFVQNSGSSTNLTLKSASMSAFVEGKSVVTGPANTVSATSNHTGEAHIFHIRNKATYLTKTNRVRCLLSQLSVGNDANQLASFTILQDATLAGVASWADVNGDDSVVESDTVQTYSSGGKVLFKCTVGKDSGQVFDLDKLNIKFVPGEILTVVSETSGAASDMQATLVWREDF
jgi:hypothetical protein